MDKLLSRIYYNTKLGYKSVDELYKAAKVHDPKIWKGLVKKWLETQPTYTVHKPARRKYLRNTVLVSTIDEQWQADLVDLQALKKNNDGFSYLLTCIDIFSKYAWAIPLKTKNSKNIIDAFQVIFDQGRKPYKLQTDAGTEFVNKHVQNFLKNHDIDFFTTKSEVKSSVVERFNRTLKERMWKVFTHKNTYTFLNFLPQLMINYNNSYHRTIHMKPSQVNEQNETEVRNAVYKIKPSTQFKFNIADKVRISKVKRHFEKGYTTNWSEEFFFVSNRFSRTPPVYSIKDQLGEKIEGIFYESELQKIEMGKSDLYIIEQILKTRKQNNKTDFFVKWRGYPEKFNSWVSEVTKV